MAGNKVAVDAMNWNSHSSRTSMDGIGLGSRFVRPSVSCSSLDAHSRLRRLDS